MAELEAAWNLLGPMPTDDKLESQLESVLHENDNDPADESIWIRRATRDAADYAVLEQGFIDEVERRIALPT